MKTKEMTTEVIEARNVKTEAVSEWFASLPPEQQQFAFELWKMIRQADANHLIEVSRQQELEPVVGFDLEVTIQYRRE